MDKSFDRLANAGALFLISAAAKNWVWTVAGIVLLGFSIWGFVQVVSATRMLARFVGL